MVVEHVDLVFSFKYTPDLISGHETNPLLHFFLSSDVGHSYVMVDPYKTNQVTLRIHNIRQKEGPFIELDASLNIAAFVNAMNDSRELSSNEGGSKSIPLKDLLHNQNTPKVTSVSLTVGNAVENAARKNLSVEKGSITLRVERIKPSQHSESVSSLFAPPTKYVAVKENITFIQQNLKNYIDRANVIFETKQASYESVKYLHYAMSLWQFNNVSVIGSMYCCSRAQHSDEQVWINLSRAALRRYYTDCNLERAIQLFMQPNTTEEVVMTVISTMHCIFANYATYISDGVEAKKLRYGAVSKSKVAHWINSGISSILQGTETIASKQSSNDIDYVSMEAFSQNLRSRGNPQTGAATSGDCEDVAWEMGLESMELKLRTDWSDPILQKMHQIRQHYAYLLTLMGVRGAQLSDAEKQQPGADYANLGGHMAGLYVSNERLETMNKKFNKVATPFVGLDKGPSNQPRSRPLVLEGTGLNETLGSDSAESTEAFRKTMIYLESGQNQALRGVKMIGPLNRQKINRFYRVLVSFCSPDLAENYASVEHVILRRNNNGTITHGCNFTEFINESPYIMTYAMPEFSEDEILVNKQLLKHRFPVIPIQGAKERSSADPIIISLEKVKALCSRLNRMPNKQADRTTQDLFVRDLLITPQFVDSWMDLIKQKTKIYDFEYFEEAIAANARGFHFRLYLNP